MAIWGIATGMAGPPVSESTLQAMSAASCQGVRSETRLLANCGMGAATRGSTVLASTPRFLIAGDAELYGPDSLVAGRSEKDTSGTQSLGEAITALYVADGVEFVQKLRGAFALAIWDAHERTLMLAVDRFGIKRLSYAETGSSFLFATHPRSILATGLIGKKVDLSAVTEYLLYNVVPIPRTAYAGIHRVAPGEHVMWSEKGVQKKSYWDMRYPEDDKRSQEVMAEELLSRMSQAVKMSLSGLDLSRTGCFLSGGTDSSSILGLLSRQVGGSVPAFSVGFSEERFNELEYARLAARQYGATHVEGKLGPEEAHGVVEKVIAGYDEPFGNSSAIPTYWCAKLAKEQGIDTLLAGDGGDELFGGNERYREEQIFLLYHRLPIAVRRWVIEPALSVAPVSNGITRKARNYVRLANTANPDRYCRWRLLQVFSPEVVLGSGMPFRNGHSDLVATMRHYHDSAPATTELNRLLYIDVKMTLGDDDLPKVTRTAEWAGVRVRFPYLDHELAEFTGHLPVEMKVRGLEKRYLFKRATRTLLPAAILKKKKHGFGLPVGFWLKSNPQWHSWAKEILYDAKTYQRGYFRREFIEQLFQNMQKDDTPYFGDLLWIFLVLELWHRRHLEATP